MILKIKGYGDDDWWIFGDIRKIHYESVNYAEAITQEFESIICDERRKDTIVEKAVAINLRLSDNEQWNILTDSIAYICNESGETVEKIVCSC